MSIQTRAAASIFALGLFAFAAPQAMAAPQALGVIASNGIATPLVCDGSGECSARISAFCLQEARDAPSQGTAYRLADTSAMTLLVRRADGSRFRLPANGYVRIESQLGFTAVKVSLPQSVAVALDATEIAVEVAPNASLLPVETAGDPDPLTEEEIALATGPMRAAAAAIFEVPGPATDAARVASLMINALPPTPVEDAAAVERIWQATVTADVRGALTPEGVVAAEDLYAGCKLAVESHTRLSMRECLALRHADLMLTSNRRFWQESGGS
jgi:hypothetical protein